MADSLFRMRVRAREIAVNMPARGLLMSEIRKRLVNGGGFALATINLDHLVKLKNNAAFGEAYAEHDFVVADGNPVVWLSKLAGRPVDLVPGCELIEPLANMAAETGVSVALFGSTQEALDQSAAKLREIVPGLTIAAAIAPPGAFDPTGPEADQAIEDLRASGARLTFIALGAPKQEIFAARARDMMGDMGFASIGAGLDFIAGQQNRAPEWVRAFAMEWLWRMASNPKRLAYRYFQCAMILPQLAIRAVTDRSGQSTT